MINRHRIASGFTMWMLDTNTCSYVLGRHPLAVKPALIKWGQSILLFQPSCWQRLLNLREFRRVPNLRLENWMEPG